MLSLKEIHRDSKLYALLVTAISLTEGCNKLKCGNCEHVTAATKQLIHQIRMDISGIWLLKSESTVKILLHDLHLPRFELQNFS